MFSVKPFAIFFCTNGLTGAQTDYTPTIAPLDTPQALHAAPSYEPPQKNCGVHEVSVQNDATYPVKGIKCSGAGEVPTGKACPLKGAKAVQHCIPSLKSFQNGECIAPKDAVCVKFSHNTWGCTFDEPLNASPQMESSGLPSQIDTSELPSNNKNTAVDAAHDSDNKSQPELSQDSDQNDYESENENAAPQSRALEFMGDFLPIGENAFGPSDMLSSMTKDLNPTEMGMKGIKTAQGMASKETKAIEPLSGKAIGITQDSAQQSVKMASHELGTAESLANTQAKKITDANADQQLRALMFDDILPTDTQQISDEGDKEDQQTAQSAGKSGLRTVLRDESKAPHSLTSVGSITSPNRKKETSDGILEPLNRMSDSAGK